MGVTAQSKARLPAEGASSSKPPFVTCPAAARSPSPAASRLVAVEPGARYRLEFFVRTEALKSVATLVLDVVSAKQGGAAMATSAPAPAGTNDWQQVAVEFTAPQDADGVVLLIRRQPCKDEACPIFGKIWYDDFTLQRVGAGQQEQQRAARPAAVGEAGGQPAR